jgi:fucose 4-O-acetylase-like acetyltransferase
MNENRIGWVDTFRGLAIILVVFAHCGRGLDKAGIDPGFERGAVDDWIYSFHMPAFFFAAGLFAARSLIRGAGRFFVDKLRTVVYPYLLWSVIFILTLMLLPGGNAKYSPDMWAKIAYAPVGNYWFLFVLFIVQMLYMVIRPWPFGPLLFYIICLTMWAVESSQVLEPYFPHATYWAWHNVLKFAVYFAFGDAVATLTEGRGDESAADSATWSLVFFVAMTMLLAFGCAPELGWVDLALALAGIQGLWELSIAIDRRGAPPWLEFLGKRSLEIYVAHNFFTVFARLMLVSMGVSDVTTHLFVGTLFGILGPLAIWWCCYRTGFRWLFTAGK